jgi:hypothetical protein
MTHIASTQSSAEPGAEDLRSLRPWLQQQHLDRDQLDGYRRAFAAHPARLVVIQDFLLPQVADRLAKFLATETQFAPEFGLYSTEDVVSEETWNRANEDDRFFRLRRLVRTSPQYQMSPNALTYVLFRKSFQSDDFRHFFESISGAPLGWSDDFGAHAMGAGDFLRPHSDDNKNRHLALVIYLTPGWRREDGGVLQVLHPDGAFTEVEPRFNSMIAFDVLSSPAHLVTPIATTVGERQRLSIGGWYHNVG